MEGKLGKKTSATNDFRFGVTSTMNCGTSALPLTKPAFKSTPLRLEPRNKNINSDLGKYSAAAEFLSDGAVDQAKLSEQRPVRRRPGR